MIQKGDIRFIACDMDGTLLNDKKEVSAQSLEYIKSLPDKKIHFAVASGRSKEAIEKVLGGISCAMVTDNGARAYTEDGQCLFCDEIDQEATMDVIWRIEKVDFLHIFLVGEKHVYTNMAQLEREKEKAQYYFSPRIKAIPDWEDAFRQDSITKLSINSGWDGKNEEKGWKVIQDLSVEEDFSPVMSGDGWIELMRSGVSKGRALKRLCANMGIDMEEIMVFGDYLNDLNMLCITPNSYAMKNGHEEVKRQCTYTTRYTNNEDGVIRAIEERLNEEMKEG